ncbi:MAG: hypothetical protein RLN88_06445 [Ekhidna sp.]|uniref:hypothetical protein n=1 Tax=Ekhidna sp. TaxID=2608089 RepID=UPI0032EB391F
MIIESLRKAAASMEQMLRIRVKPEIIQFGEGMLKPLHEFDDLGRFKVNLMKVAFRGEINGAFYFVINSHEMDLINQVCLPDDIRHSRSSHHKLMRNDFMSEIENLIANMSIAALSEFLGVQVIGEVPIVRNMKGELVNAYLENENEQNHTAFFLKSTLNGAVVNIAPHFLWMIDENFVRITKLNTVA